MTYPVPLVLHVTAAGAGLFLLLGLWTPLVGILVAILEVALAIPHRADLSMHLLLAMLGATLAMIGPGAWSLDARLFGRKQVRM